MATVPEDKSAGEQLSASEANLLRDGAFLIGTAGETIAGATLPVPSFIDPSDNEFYACDANDTTRLQFDGFAISSSTDGNSIQIQTSGVVGGFSGLTPGVKYYVQDTIGTIGTSVGTNTIFVGVAVSATQILIQKTPRIARGVISDLATTSAGNNDVTVTIGFRPKTIVLHYYIQGYDFNGGSPIRGREKGVAFFEGTTLKFKNLSAFNNSGAPADNANITFTSSDVMPTAPNLTSALSAGDGSDPTNGINVTVTINSLSDTGFVIRRVTTVGGSGTENARAKIAYEAFE